MKSETCLVFVGRLSGNPSLKLINTSSSINKWHDDDDSVEYRILINRVAFISPIFRFLLREKRRNWEHIPNWEDKTNSKAVNWSHFQYASYFQFFNIFSRSLEMWWRAKKLSFVFDILVHIYTNNFRPAISKSDLIKRKKKTLAFPFYILKQETAEKTKKWRH